MPSMPVYRAGKGSQFGCSTAGSAGFDPVRDRATVCHCP
jgi:hypothetical protein